MQTTNLISGFLIALFINAMTVQAFAQSNAAQAEFGAQKAKFSGFIGISHFTTLNEGARGSAGEGLSQQGSYNATLRYNQMPWDMMLEGRIWYIKQFSYAEDDNSEGHWEDTRFRLRKSFGSIGKNIITSSSVGWVVPHSKASLRSELKSSFFADTAFIINPGYNISIVALPRITKNWHDVTVADDGTINSSIAARLFLNVSYNFTRQLDVTALFWPGRTWSYEGVPKDNYLTGLSVGYQWNKYLNTGLGFSTAGSPLTANGRDTDYQLFDANETTASFDVTITL